MLQIIESVNEVVNKFIWGIPAMVCIIGVGVYLSIRMNFIQIRKFPLAMKQTIGKVFEKKEAVQGALTPFQAVCTALSATVGTGNIAGVAGAIAIGGPGAVFWMWISAFLGMCTKFSEVILAVHYRERNEQGELVGGPMYYIKNGLGKQWHWLAVLFSIFGVFTVFGTGNATQVNTITAAINSALLNYNLISESNVATSNLVIGVIIMLLVGSVLLGGVVGSFFTSVTKGVSRGIFSNEAGLGTGSIAHACADTKKPVQQGFFGIFEVFADTIIICTLTAFVILCSGVPISYGVTAGAELTILGFTSTYGNWVSIFTAVAMCCFAFSTIIGWGLYGARCIEFILSSKAVKPFMVAYSLVAIVGATVDLGLVWSISDTCNGLMLIPNLIGVFLLSGTVFELVKEYLNEK